MIQHDPKTWPRRQHYAFFRNQSHPYLAITARVPIGSLLRARDGGHLSPFSLFLFCVAKATNQVSQLCQRIRVEDGRDIVVEHDAVSPAYVVQARDDLFNFATVPYPQELEAFCKGTRIASDLLRDDSGLSPFDGIRDDVIYTTCTPWLDFTHISHPIDTKIVDSVPRVAWGQFRDDETVAVNIQAHHALVDGRHIALFFQSLKAALQALPPAS